MYLFINILVVVAFIASAAVGYHTYHHFAALDGLQRGSLMGLFGALTVAWVAGRIWMVCNRQLNPNRRR